jgi:hypothetical protein
MTSKAPPGGCPARQTTMTSPVRTMWYIIRGFRPIVWVFHVFMLMDFCFFLDEARLQVELLELMHARHRCDFRPSRVCRPSILIRYPSNNVLHLLFYSSLFVGTRSFSLTHTHTPRPNPISISISISTHTRSFIHQRPDAVIFHNVKHPTRMLGPFKPFRRILPRVSRDGFAPPRVFVDVLC